MRTNKLLYFTEDILTLSTWASITGIGAFFITLFSIAFAAWRFIKLREKDQKSDRFITYHKLVKHIGSGADEHGVMAITSQIAYIYELRNFPEYSDLTKTLLNRLDTMWKKGEKDETYEVLSAAIKDTLQQLK